MLLLLIRRGCRLRFRVLRPPCCGSSLIEEFDLDSGGDPDGVRGDELALKLAGMLCTDDPVPDLLGALFVS